MSRRHAFYDDDDLDDGWYDEDGYDEEPAVAVIPKASSGSLAACCREG